MLCWSVAMGQEKADFIPLPEQAVSGNALLEPAAQAIEAISTLNPKMPDSFVVHNEGGQVNYDSEHHTIIYTAGAKPLFVRTGEGQEIFAQQVIADTERRIAWLSGPLTIYQGETLSLAEEGAYDWEHEVAHLSNVRAKSAGIIIRGTDAIYDVTSDKKKRVTINNAFVTTDDVEKPPFWVGTGTLTVYPGDYGRITRLSVAGGESEEDGVPVPLLGWIPISHSLNPDEGYMPMPGVKSRWGTYLLNRYGFLLGNRRVEHGIPVSDYLATAIFDFRSRRGLAGGAEFSDYGMEKKYSDVRGLLIYGIDDKRPEINPLRTPRSSMHHSRYRVVMSAIWDIPMLGRVLESEPDAASWSLTVNVNALSDQYVLQDFFEEDARINNNPDNNLRLERRTPRSSTTLFTRFAPNDFYSTDERAEIYYHQPRTVIKNTRIAYETRTSASVMRQNIPAEQRETFRLQIDRLRDPQLQEYYKRLLNTSSYVRVNSTHELASSVKVMRFLNVTPKVGGGYSGYYDVESVGADNRIMGYVGCDFDIKFYRHFSSIRMPDLGINGIYHVFHPYAEVSHGTISSSNPYVPQVDMWSTTLGNSTVCPMPMDLMEFTGIDGWAKWTVWRLGTRNTLSTVYDGESRTVLDWNCFLDYNITNPNTGSIFSNLYSLIKLNLTKQCTLKLETQTPTIREGDGFNQYNTSLQMVPLPWLETQVGHRYISGHPIQADANYAYFQFNIRLNEKYSAALRVNIDLEHEKTPIQQFSLSRKCGPWYVGTTLMLRDNGGKHEVGVGLSFTLGETNTTLPLDFS